jgi:hypothetical protein
LDVEAVRINGAGIQIRRKVTLLIAGHDALLDFRQQHVTLDRRTQRRNEQAVLPADIRADDRRAGEAADTVRLEPFFRESGFQILAFGLTKGRAHVLASMQSNRR